MPPGFRRIFTPARVVAMGNSRAVTSRDQPPGWSRLRAMPNENFRLGMVPASVLGGVRISGFCRSRATLRGPGSVPPSLPRIGCGTWFISSLWFCEVFCMLGFLSHSRSECHVQEEMKHFLSSLRVKDDFNIAIETLIKFLKGLGRLRERQAMRNDLTRTGSTGDNQIAQLGVVALIRIATHAYGDAFTEERLPRNSEITAFFDLPDRLGIVREEHPNNAKASVRIDQAGQIMNDLIGLLAGGISAVTRLKPNRIDAAVHSAHALFPTPRRPSMCAEASALFQDLFDRVASAKVNRDGSKLPSFGQPLRDGVHHVHFARPPQVQGTIGREQTDRASAENGHALPFGDLSEFGRMVAGGKGISQQHKIMFPLVSRFSWEAQAVGIGKRDTHQLCLGSPVR